MIGPSHTAQSVALYDVSVDTTMFCLEWAPRPKTANWPSRVFAPTFEQGRLSISMGPNFIEHALFDQTLVTEVRVARGSLAPGTRSRCRALPRILKQWSAEFGSCVRSKTKLYVPGGLLSPVKDRILVWAQSGMQMCMFHHQKFVWKSTQWCKQQWGYRTVLGVMLSHKRDAMLLAQQVYFPARQVVKWNCSGMMDSPFTR